MKFYGRVRGGKRNKWKSFGIDFPCCPVMAEKVNKGGTCKRGTINVVIIIWYIGSAQLVLYLLIINCSTTACMETIEPWILVCLPVHSFICVFINHYYIMRD